MKILEKPKNFIKNIKFRIRCAIKYMLGNTYDHFLCFYPGNSEFLIKRLIKRLVDKLDLDDHNIKKIKEINEESIVVYTSKNKRYLYRSGADLLILAILINSYPNLQTHFNSKVHLILSLNHLHPKRDGTWIFLK